ncbi:EKC/KEOPS complex subunit Tprkb-like [Ostrinia furnacalis]|uniref:EKC/KEOPS complex subunit Tprkb-like n=1 Tax=Ostrinia furnacalis TaxID=93504 RepID=UPI00103CF9C8|nr:EKC/KEOPS complex subunit Tprkb-like [Ostrinia furnacalis]
MEESKRSAADLQENCSKYQQPIDQVIEDSLKKQVYLCKLDPESGVTLHVHLFKNVRNVEDIRMNILKGTWKCAIIKPALILDPLQIAVAANKAVISEQRNAMTTRNVYTEVLFNLSITKNIGQSLNKFGIEKDTDMLVCFLIASEDNSAEILSKIEGERCPISSLIEFRDLRKIKNVYKFNGLKCDVDLQEMLNIIISRMVTKNIVSY